MGEPGHAILRPDLAFNDKPLRGEKGLVLLGAKAAVIKGVAPPRPDDEAFGMPGREHDGRPGRRVVQQARQGDTLVGGG